MLHGVDLDVAAGAVVAVLGGSGSGKTTLLRVVAGFHPVDAGSVHIAGRLVAGSGTDVAAEHRGVGLVPQDGALFGHLTVAGNVAFGLPRRPGRDARVAEVLELVGLPDHARRRPGELSGGQQQRVALARALAPRPALVLLDEPFTALDAGLRAEVREQVCAALRAAGAAAVLVTHDQQEALGAADVVAVLAHGRVVQAGSPRELYSAPVDPEVGAFVGEAVLLTATVRDGVAGTVVGPLPVSGPDGPGRVLLRPEQLRLRPGGPAVVREVVFHGHDSTVLVDLDGTLLRCRTAGSEPPAVGARVGVAVAGAARFYPA